MRLFQEAVTVISMSHVSAPTGLRGAARAAPNVNDHSQSAQQRRWANGAKPVWEAPWILLLPLLIFVSICVLSPAMSYAHNDCPKAKCEETKQKIEKIQAKMRQGYSRAQGEKMEAKLRSLRAIRSKRCR